MAARSLTDWTRWIDPRNMQTGESMNEEEPDDIFSDLEYALDAEWMSIVDCFRPFQVEYSDDNHDWILVRSYSLYQQDRCDVASAVEPTVEWCAYVWSDGVATPGVRVVTTAASNNSVDHVGSISATPHWSSFGHGTTRVKTDDVVDTVDIYLSVDSGGASSGDVWIAGFGMFVEAV